MRLPLTLRRNGFTLIELIIVMAIIALLSSIVAPRYFKAVDDARVVALQTSLKTMRDAIDKFAADKGRYPDTLGELVSEKYLREVPEDPVCGNSTSWVPIMPPADSVTPGIVADVVSGASGQSHSGAMFKDY